ncbi:MAG: S-layer homology domain-containing protein, partial [Leptolyngbyaceae bacterium]|nr:S-layer homology domain-containing protein [Leptolyngbyaceae bacterium]
DTSSSDAAESSQTTDNAEDSQNTDADQSPSLPQTVAQTDFTIEFQPNGADSQQAFNTDSDESSDNQTRLTPEDARLFSQADPDTADSEPSTRSASRSSRSQNQSSASFTDLDQAPEELQPYLEDLAVLGILTAPQRSAENAEGSAANRSVSSSTAFKPNEPITRQEYAQWLLTANNLFYGDRPSRKIRTATSSTSSAFQDVSSSNPSYAAIQGLADAGLIPSSLSGDTTVNFRPTAPLTREDLIRWKVPLDRRGALPSTTLSAVEEAWGFQDADQINPAALPMVFADYQNGDQSNILRAFGYTTLFQPQKAVTRAEAAAVLWHFGYQADGISADEL